MAVVEVRREGREEAEEWHEPTICVAVVEVRVKEERKQSKWREPASVRAGCGGSA